MEEGQGHRISDLHPQGHGKLGPRQLKSKAFVLGTVFFFCENDFLNQLLSS
jgi:hypothetical protein